MKKEQDKVDKGDEEIDILELLNSLWTQRKRIIIWCICGAIVGLVVGFSIPKEYTTTVRLSPETNNKSSAINLSAIASLAGFATGGGATADAVYPMLYPDVVESVPFMTSLFYVRVPLDNEDNSEIELDEYIKDNLKEPWWSYIFGIPGKVIQLFKSDADSTPNHKLDTFKLTKEESLIVEALRDRISASYDIKTSIISVSVRMQDPLVSAVLADTVVDRLQEFITDYRTNKARQDLAYANMLNQEAKNNYYEAQQRYADYLDRNQGVVLHSVQTTRERLENESQLAFNLYNQTAQQVQLAQAKIQETTPVYAIVTPATVPIRPSSPKKLIILIGFTFIFGIACALWIILGDSVKHFINRPKVPQNNDESE